MRVATLICVLAAWCWTSSAISATAFGADLYVDSSQGDDSFSCTDIDEACLTIQHAVEVAQAGDTITAYGDYSEHVSVGKAVTLIGGSTPLSVIDGGSGAPAVTVPDTAKGVPTIANFNLKGTGARTVRLQKPANLSANKFDEAGGAATIEDIRVDSTADGSVISGNEFSDTSTTRCREGVVTFGSPEVRANTFDGLCVAAHAQAPPGKSTTPLIEGNTITGSRGYGIYLFNGPSAIVADNEISSPAVNSTGIYVQENAAPGSVATGATLRRNRIIGMHTAVNVFDTSGSVTLDSDLIVQSTSVGLNAANIGGVGAALVHATNVTFADNETNDVQLGGNHLDLDSGIVTNQISAGSGATCTISDSRGPDPGGLPSANGCETFQTHADPLFVDTAAPPLGYRLQVGSPMVDAGNPLHPSANSLDAAADPREVEGDGVCPPRRDIGAYERQALPAFDCTNPDTVMGSFTIRRAKRRATFRFTGSDDQVVASFQCKLDKRSFSNCTSPKNYRNLKKGKHTFRVRARDGAGNLDPVPARKRFRI
jgi:parallel beta-helix repeat protein